MIIFVYEVIIMVQVVNEIRQAGMIIQKVKIDRPSLRNQDAMVRIIDTNTGFILSDPCPRRKRVTISH